MRRKLIKQGAGGLTMSIPKKWAEKRGLNPGDEIDVEESEQDLLISTTAKKAFKELELDIAEQNTNRLRTMIASAYRRGYDRIILTSNKGFSFADLNWVADSLTGYVITDQTEKRVVIKSIMAEDFEDVPAILNKLFITVKFFASSTESYLGKNEPGEHELEELAKSIIRLRDYCQRMIHLTKYGGDRSYEYNTLVFITEKFAGNMKQLFRSKKSLNPSTIKHMLTQLKECQTLFTDLNSALAKKDLDKAVRLNKKIGKMQKDSYMRDDVHAAISGMLENLLGMSSRIVGILI